MPTAINPLRPELITAFIQNFQGPIEIQACLASTHLELKQRAASGTLSFPSVLLAEQQSKGIGQGNKNWYSPSGENIYLSCAWAFTQDLSGLQGLSLVIGLATIETLQSLGIADNIKIKWPNDILFADKKIAGILVDIDAKNQQNSQAIISIGLNVNMHKSESINQAWSSLYLIKNQGWDRNQVAGSLINVLGKYLSQFAQFGFAHFVQQWQQYDYLLQKSITVKNSTGDRLGIGAGVDIHGRLLHLTTDGKITAYASAEIRV